MTQTGRLLVVAALSVLSMLALPGAQAGTLKKGAPFMQTRAQLLKEGWRPVNVHAGEDYPYMGTESALIQAKVVEVESCAVDRPLCILHYQRDKRCLRVITAGEEVPAMTIDSWTYRCPESPGSKDH